MWNDGTRAARRAWLVNPFDPLPGTGHRPMRYEALATALVEGGWEVVWFTADFDHLSRRFRAARAVDRVAAGRGVRVELVHVPAYEGTFSPARLRSHRRYIRALATRMQDRGLAAPGVVVASVPLLGALRACLRLRSATGAAVVADVQDLWPEAFDTLLPPPIRLLARPLRAYLVARARRAVGVCDGVIAVSDTYLRARAAGAPGLRAYLGSDVGMDWTPREVARRRPASGPTTFFWGGSIRPAADLTTVVRGAAVLRGRGVPVRVVIAGDGPTRPRLLRLAARLRLDERHVAFPGRYSEAEHAALLATSHVGLNTYVAGTAISVTNKLFDYQAGGLAILNSVPGEVADLVAAHGMGLTYEAGDVESFAATAAALAGDPRRTLAMGAAARRFAETEGCRRTIARRVVEFLDRLLDGRRTPAGERAAACG